MTRLLNELDVDAGPSSDLLVLLQQFGPWGPMDLNNTNRRVLTSLGPFPPVLVIGLGSLLFYSRFGS